MGFKVEQITFEFTDSKEVAYRYAGKRGAKGEKRAPRRRRTPEQMARQNQRNRTNRLRRKIKKNFTPRDLWVTLKYPAGERKTVKELKKDFTNFVKCMRRRYRKHGAELKYIYRMEVGKNGGLHVHLLVNRIPDIDLHIRDAWKHGRVWYTNIYEEGGYTGLAEYIAKKPDGQVRGQMSLFPEEDRGQLVRYGCSRNLEEPVPEVRRFSRWTMRKFMDGDAPKASPGFFVDMDSVYTGVNPFTGLSYVTYTEYRIGKTRKEAEGKAPPPS